MWNPLDGLSTVTVRIKKLRPEATVPTYGSAEAAGADIYSCVYSAIEPGARAIIDAGFAIELPAGFEAQVRPRSGLSAKNGISVVNTPGTVDSDYRGEIKVILINHGKEPFFVKPGDRIAQMVIVPIFRAKFQPTTELTESVRGENGFGSTGR